MSPLDIAELIIGLAAKIAAACGADYAEVMGELHKRTAVDTSELDKAADEQDAPLRD